MTGQDVVTIFIQMREQYQVFHWQTTSFAQHKAFDYIYDALSGNIDKFMEAYLGRYGRQGVTGPFKPILLDLAQADPVAYTDHSLQVVGQLKTDVKEAEDLNNILQDMEADLNKLKYLLTLK